jgi:hypothetical protein
MGMPMLRNRLKRAEWELRGHLDYLGLTSGTRFYFDPQQAQWDLFWEGMHKGLYSKPGTAHTVDTPEIREALTKATPESLAHFEERYGAVVGVLPGAVGYSEDLLCFRYIELDGTVRSFVVEGETARERERSPGFLAKIVPLNLDDLPVEDVQEISSEKEAQIWEARGVRPEGVEER